MIRWKYLAPRLTVLGLVCLFYWFALDPLLRRALIAMGQKVVGAKVEIGGLSSSLLHTDVHLDRVRIADPRRPMENLLEFDRAALDLDTKALLRRQLVVDEGSLHGLRIGSARDASGALDADDPSGSRGRGVQLPEFPLQWLENLTDSLQDKLEEELQSVRLAKQLIAHWPAEYERLQQRAQMLCTRIAELRRLAENAQSSGQDPLQALGALRRATAELQQIQLEMNGLQDEINRLAQQVSRDKRAIADAKQRDAQQIRAALKLKNVNAGALSQYLVGPELSEQIAAVAEWVRWGRKYVPRKVEQPKPVRGRGTIVRFDRRPQQPDFLIRLLSLQGEGRFRQQPFQFLGTATGITSQPDVYGRPTVVRVQTTGSVKMLTQLYLDHTGKTARDRVAIECPQINQPQRVLGDEDHLAVTVSPGNAGLWVLLDLHGDKLSGQLVLQQRDVRLVSRLNPRYGGKRLGEGLQAVISRIDHLEARVALSGTLKKPRLQLHCSLGEQLAEGLSWLLQREIEMRGNELAAELERRVTQQLAVFDQVVAAQRQKLSEKLQLGHREIEQLVPLVAGRGRVPIRAFGRDGLPAQVFGKAASRWVKPAAE